MGAMYGLWYIKKKLNNRKCTEKSDQISKKYTTSELHRTPEIYWIAITSIERADMVETFKILNNIDKVQHEHIFPISRTATRSHNQKMYKKNCRTNIIKYSFSQRIVDMWNSLPKQVLVIETKTVNTFKSQLNNQWKNPEIKFSPDVYRLEEKKQSIKKGPRG